MYDFLMVAYFMIVKISETEEWKGWFSDLN
jgi:hypothetical protein